MHDDGGEVIDLPQARPKPGLHPGVISDLLAEGAPPDIELTPEVRQWIARLEAKRDGQPPPNRKKEPPAAGPDHEMGTAKSFEELTPLPKAGDPYVAHSRVIFSRPLTTLFLLPRGQLPYGIAYPNLEDVWMADPIKPGGSPDLMMLVNGLRPEGSAR